jgi:hypothetical protein
MGHFLLKFVHINEERRPDESKLCRMLLMMSLRLPELNVTTQDTETVYV